MNTDQANKLLEDMAPLFGLEKVYHENGWRWGYANERPDAQVVEHDYGWREPTQAQIDALHYVCEKLHLKVPPNEPPFTWHEQVMWKANGRALAVDADIFSGPAFKLDMFDLAETIIMFPGTLGYSQLKNWIKEPPSWAPADFPMAAAYLKKLVDSGYSEGHWYPEAENMSNYQLVLLVSFENMLAQVTRTSSYIVSSTIMVLLKFFITSGTRKLKTKVKSTPRTAKCIHPECNNEVDLTKKKSGACCKEHMNYECTHPACVARAQVNGWARATHPFGYKISEKHWEFRKR